MKIILSMVFCLGFLNLSFGQKDINDVKVYNMWSSYDYDTEKWSEWKANDEVFILNHNNSENIARCRLNNTILMYKKNNTAPIKKGKTPNGYEYQEIAVTGEFFVPYTLRFYENNPDFGLELIAGTVLIRFAKK